MIVTGKERYRWLARQSPARRKPRHLFVEDSFVSLCTSAVRAREEDRWQPEPEREKCRVCARKLAQYRNLQEVA